MGDSRGSRAAGGHLEFDGEEQSYISTSAPRIAILGFDLESNRFAPVATREDFQARWFYHGTEIDDAARAVHPVIHGGICGFYAAMDIAAKWTPVPIAFAGSVPSGPVDHTFFEELVADMRHRLRAALPLDGVYVCQHGGAVATHTHDPDGRLFEMVREVVGPDVPIVATLDLHANISASMVNATDVLISYRTNPHVDQRERGEEAAACLKELISGTQTVTAWVCIPLVAPTVTQLTALGQPYGDLIALGQSKVDADVMNVSILTGFSFSDTPKNGLSVVVTTRDKPDKASFLAQHLARAAWKARHRFQPKLTSLEEATRRAREVGADTQQPSLLFADVADNPGGGGRGNTVYILRAFCEAEVQGALLGVFNEPHIVDAAFAAGEGGAFEAHFNADRPDPHSDPFVRSARVVRLSENGEFVGNHGSVKDRTVRLGRSCAIELGSCIAVVNGVRQQTFSPDYFDHFGFEVSAARSIVVKSRGHFRAGFQHLFPPERILEVDAPGLTSPNLANFNWLHLPRPVYPLDPMAGWNGDEANVHLRVGRAAAREQ